MQHNLTSSAFRIPPSVPATTRKAPLGGSATTPGALLVRIVGVVALVAASVAAIADQSTRFVSGQEVIGVHEIPAFLSGRIELTPGLSTDSTGPSERDPAPATQRMGGPGSVRTAGDPSQWSSR